MSVFWVFCFSLKIFILMIPNKIDEREREGRKKNCYSKIKETMKNECEQNKYIYIK